VSDKKLKRGPKKTVPKPTGEAVRLLGEVGEEREDRSTVAENMFTSQRPDSWELKKTSQPATKTQLL